jgi:hypothetical protein
LKAKRKESPSWDQTARATFVSEIEHFGKGICPTIGTEAPNFSLAVVGNIFALVASGRDSTAVYSNNFLVS